MSLSDELADLAALHDSGDLSDAEYEAAKRQVLGTTQTSDQAPHAHTPAPPSGPPVAAPPTSAKTAKSATNTKWIVIGAAAIVVLIVAVAVVAITRDTADNGAASGNGATQPVQTSKVSLKPLTGWVISDDGLTAENASDSSQRVQILSDDVSAASAADLPDGTIDGVVNDPGDTMIDGKQAVTIAVLKGDIVQGWTFISLDNGDTQAVLLEAPEDLWEASKATMASMIDVQ